MAWRRFLKDDELGPFLRAFLAFAGWRAAGVAALMGLGALFEGVSLLLLVPLMNLVTGAPHTAHWAGVALPAAQPPGALHLQALGTSERLLILVTLAMGLMAIRGAVLTRRDLAANRLQLAFVESIRMRLVRRLASGRWETAAKVRHARLVQALTVEIHQVGAASHSLILAAVAGVMLVANGAIAVWLAPAAAPVVLGFALIGALLSRPYLDRASGLGRSIAQAHAAMTETSVTFLSGMKLATAQGLQDAFLTGYAATASEAMADRLLFTRAQAGLRGATAIASAMIGAAALLAGALVFHLAPSVLIALLVILARMAGPAQALQQAVQLVLHNLPAYGQVLALDRELDQSSPSPTPRGSRALSRDHGLVFSQVSFAHAAGQPPVLRQVSLVIPRGAFVGVAGPSGIGKTTFLDLASGLLAPQHGHIFVGGRELAGPWLAHCRAGLAYVAQDAFLLDDTVRRNLAWGAAACSEVQMLDALEQVGAQALLRRLEHGLDTRIGERGTLISAGERQRLALARAILRRPSLLVLDEATNAIDVAGEREVLEALSRLRPHATILMAAHRAESLGRCDHRLEFPGPRLVRSAAAQPARSLN